MELYKFTVSVKEEGQQVRQQERRVKAKGIKEGWIKLITVIYKQGFHVCKMEYIGVTTYNEEKEEGLITKDGFYVVRF